MELSKIPGSQFREKSHTYWRGNRRMVSVTEVLQAQGFVDTRWYTEAARDRGVKVHLALQYFNEGCLDFKSLHPVILGRVKAYQKFISDYKFKVEEFETLMMSEALGLAGTLDLKGHSHGEHWLVDFKSGPVQYWCGLQLAGYKILSGQNFDKHIGLELCENGDYEITHFTDKVGDKSQFLSALSNYQLRLKHRAAPEAKPINWEDWTEAEKLAA